MSEAGVDARADLPSGEIVAALGRIFPSDVATAALLPHATPADLSPIESRAGSRFAGPRLQHFALGRACARAALRRLTGADADVGMLASGSPAWPVGVIGSISHSRVLVAAAAARAGAIADLGIDVEDGSRHSDRLTRWACTAPEAAALERLPVPEGAAGWSAVVFSVKEAVYKAVNPTTGIPLRFHDVELDLEPEAGGWTVRLVRDVEGPVDWVGRLSGRYEVVDGIVLSSAILRPGG